DSELVVFDTGSSDLLLPSTECDGTCDGHTQYDPAASSSAKDSGQPFVLAYGAGETAGEEYVNDVFVGGYEAEDQTLGVAWVYSPEFSKDEFPPDGLSGLAFPEISQFEGPPLFRALAESGKLPQASLGSSYLLFQEKANWSSEEQSASRTAITGMSYRAIFTAFVISVTRRFVRWRHSTKGGPIHDPHSPAYPRCRKDANSRDWLPKSAAWVPDAQKRDLLGRSKEARK
ncbi:aspartic peptidase domain-containing protein, partial [Suillus americanus]